MWRYEYEYAENVDMKSVTGADSNSCGHVVKSLTWRDRRSTTRLRRRITSRGKRGVATTTHQRDISKWQGYPRVWRCVVEKRQWQHDCREVTVWERRRSGDRWVDCKMCRDAGLGGDRGDWAA